jgi:Flp pilus assembly protein CpaB
MRKVMVGLLGVVLMAVSVYGYIRFMQYLDHDRNTLLTLKPVRTLLSGEVIEAGMLRRVEIPGTAHREDAIVDVAMLSGRVVVVPIGKDEEVTGWKLSPGRVVPLLDERYYSFKTDAVANVNNMVRKGDRVDVWMEWKNPDPNREVAMNTVAIKVIAGLPVSAVKSAEGIEVEDRITLDAAISTDAAMLSQARSKPGGLPALNTYIMADEVYQAYAAAAAAGTIRLALPNLTQEAPDHAYVTAEFSEWQALWGSRISQSVEVEPKKGGTP